MQTRDEIIGELATLCAARSALLEVSTNFDLTCNGVDIPMVSSLYDRLWQAAHEEVNDAIAELAERLVNAKA